MIGCFIENMNMDHFTRLGLPRRFSIDLQHLEREYLARSREFHPDFHTDASSIEQSQAERESAALNEAYVTLKDPLKRAEYLLQLLGGPSASEMKEIPQAFLMEMLDLREEIETAKGNDAKLQNLSHSLESRYADELKNVESLFGLSTPSFKQIRQTLNAIKYLRGLIRDL